MLIYKWRPKTMSKKLTKQLMNYTLVIIGTILLAFGAVIFFSKVELVAGGVSGIAIIIQHFVKNVYIYDYLVAAFMVLFWLLGLVFIGKDFALKTLLSSLVYIGATFLFSRVGFFNNLAEHFAGVNTANQVLINGSQFTIVYTDAQVGNYMLCGLFGGVFVGGGVALTFLGGGSTGGVDVIQVALNKYFHIKESISSFVIDAFIIIVGMAAMQLWVPALCGILSCFVSAVLIEVVYIRNQTSYQVDIISEKWKEINQFAQIELDRGTTIIHAEGGYKGDKRVILRVVFNKNQYEKLKDYIAQVDPTAFVTFTQTNAVYGEGFRSNKKSIKIRKK